MFGGDFMWNDGKELKKQLVNLEKLKEGIMLQLNKLDQNDEAVKPTTVYPVAKVKTHNINGYPVMQFNYEGLLPHFIEDREHKKLLKKYYFHSTVSAYDYEGIEGVFGNEVFIIFCQYFKNNIVRDLDNRNTKYIQDAINSMLIINGDDDWSSVWNMNMGFGDKDKNHTQVYVVERKNFIDFYKFLEENHYELMDKTNFPIDKKEFINTFNKENKPVKTEVLEEKIVVQDWFSS